MTGSAEQRIVKAEEFLRGATLCAEAGLANPATSCAVTAGILANDAICVIRVGRFSVGRSHGEALALVRTAGPVGRQAATILTRLLAVKDKAQYASVFVGPAAARQAVFQAGLLIELAKDQAGGGT